MNIRTTNAPYLEINLLGRVRLNVYRSAATTGCAAERLVQRDQFETMSGAFIRVRHVGVLAAITGNGRRRSSTCCPAPARTSGGTMQCVVRRDACTEPGHRRWDRIAWLMRLVWAVKPWWPNELGRAQDAGLAHTPNVYPCKHCERLRRERTFLEEQS